MADVLVVGSGFAGLSAAARLAKLRHRVTVLERDETPGGLLRGVEIGERRWPAGPSSVTLPGVFRDLFRKSGRTMDALVTISPAPARHHVIAPSWPRREVRFDLPFGTRSAQHDAVGAAFGSDAWSPWVDDFADPWDTLRRTVLEVVGDRSPSPAEHAAMGGDRTVEQVARRLPRLLRSVAVDRPGVAPDSPAVFAVWHYVERNFGRWAFDGGDAGLAAALVTRLGERRVPIETGVEVASVIGDDRVTGVRLVDGSMRDADVVLWATGDTASSLHLTGLELAGAEPPPLFTVHGREPVHGWRAGDDRWVLASRAPDPVEAAAAGGLDLRSAIVERHALPATGSSRPRTLPRPTIEIRPGLWRLGGAAWAGAGLEITGMGTAALAAHLGPAPR